MIITEDAYLKHHGIKGMHWGIRRDNLPGVSSKTNRTAAKDAKEFARAKLFFGEGAGNRRKLIKATVEARKKQSASYAKAFDHHLANQDLSKHADKARSERSRKDKSKAAKQTSGAIARRLTGEMGTKAAFVALAAGGAAYLNSPHGRSNLNRTISKLRNIAASRRGASFVRNFNNLVNNSGLG